MFFGLANKHFLDNPKITKYKQTIKLITQAENPA